MLPSGSGSRPRCIYCERWFGFAVVIASWLFAGRAQLAVQADGPSSWVGGLTSALGLGADYYAAVHRHPLNIPIEVSITGHSALDQMTHASDLGCDGLAFRYDHNIELGTLVHIKISYIQPEFETEAKSCVAP